MDVRLVDPAARPGRGWAYGTDDPRHLLNVPARRMSAFAEDPGDFARWLAARGHTCAEGGYAPRMLYGAYLADVLDEAGRHSVPAWLRFVRDEVVRVDDAGPVVAVTLGCGRVRRSEAAILALGNAGLNLEWAPTCLRASDLFVGDPWRPGALASVPPVPPSCSSAPG
ncbi:FAD/NAD(P)-binding protein [Streptomyces hygroscopicus]|uniref:FAD/NAD(P)-binding protein n=1 Tax=Streptomyces hygroscopicus TaxID=1912 RepID=UPI0036393BFA